ncbi:MAG: Stp1/IreP family PP2C-type Ser/Thr phosphatase [Candidatus Omnitrophota bacterium]
MKIDYFGKTDKGKIRKINEDYFMAKKVGKEDYLFIVADGMGGHRAGNVASKLGTTSFAKEYKTLRRKGIPVTDAMNRAMMKANSAIQKKAAGDQQKQGMGTTFSAAAILGMNVYLAHVGDSRIYLIRDDRLTRLTTDHTFVGKMVQEGRLTEDEARDHPQRNILYMSLGASQHFEPELGVQVELRNNDILIMCSDGLNTMVEESVIKEYALSYDVKNAVEQLIDLANRNGGVDNVTIQMIQINQKRVTSKTEPIPIMKMKRDRFSFLKQLFGKTANGINC